MVELPKLAQGLRTDTSCDLNFYEQGIQRVLHFRPDGGEWVVEATSDGTRWKAPRPFVRVSKRDLCAMVREIERTMREVLDALDAGIGRNPSLRRWLDLIVVPE
jgi:hypothetical protein